VTEAIIVGASNGARIADGFKRGTLVKNIRLAGDPGSIERGSRRVASRTDFVKTSRG
jgi:uncharacterized Zn ribbon protein